MSGASISGAFLEGIEASAQPCTLALALPCLGIALASRAHLPYAVGGFSAAAGVVAWARFSGHWPDLPTGIWLLMTGGAVVACAVAAFARSETAFGAAAVTGAVSAWLWTPCVGQELAAIVNNAPERPIGQLPATLAYVGGTVLILGLVAALTVLFEPVRRTLSSRWSGRVGVAIAAVLGALIAVGSYDDVVAELLERSSVT